MLRWQTLHRLSHVRSPQISPCGSGQPQTQLLQSLPPWSAVMDTGYPLGSCLQVLIDLSLVTPLSAQPSTHHNTFQTDFSNGSKIFPGYLKL